MRGDAALPRSFRFARGLRWSLLGQAAGLAVGLVATPVLVSRLGLERYGLYVLLQAAASWLSLLTLGAGAAAVRWIAALKTAGDGRGMRRAARLTLLFHGPAVLAGSAALALAARPLLARVFRVPEPLLALGADVLALGAAGAFFFVLSLAAGALLQGLQRFDAQATVSFLQGAPTAAGAAVLAALGADLRAVALWYAAWNAIVAALSLAWAGVLLRRAAPDQGPGRVPPGEFASWGLSQWVSSVAGLVCGQFDRVFAARHATLAGLTLYAVPVGLLQRLQVLPAMLSTVLAPMLVEFEAGDREGLRRLYLRATRVLFGLVLPILVLLFCLIPQFLSIWLGGEFGDRSVWPARLLILAQAAGLLSNLPNTTAFARGRPWSIPVLTWSQAAASSLAWALLAPRWGLLGIAWGTLLAQSLPALVFAAWAQRRVLDLPPSRFLREGLFAPALASLLLLAAVFPLHAWAGTWTRLIGVSAAGLVFYAAAFWRLAPPLDRELALGYLRWERSPR
ncbi:MAG: oligosaccharide flippase family protein [Elusimicrobia bacterium]|nr:oligosaccharide flippase family protein [Elusimicrobiota bacterium]